jgi:3-phenylpropionate/trans-cinnamate dioxygenase ferredoxin component
VTIKAFISAAKTDDFYEGTIKSFKIVGHEILVAKIAGQFYAADNICPHTGQADLSLGTLSGTILTCPLHNSKFDLVDGRIIRWSDWTGIMAGNSRLFRSPRPLNVYRTKVENDEVMVEV